MYNFNVICIHTLVVLCFISSFTYGQHELDVFSKLKNAKWSCKIMSECAHSGGLLFLRNQIFSCSDDTATQKIWCPEMRTSRFKRTTVVTNKTSDEPERDPKKIIWQKCQEYAKYRFINVTLEEQIIGEEPIFNQIRDCKAIEPLIVGGTEAKEKEFPHMALIGFGDEIPHVNWVCGGSLINEEYVLSAAHCTTSGSHDVVNWVLLGLLSKQDITVDKSNENIFHIIERFNHPDYHPPMENNDIALYKLETPVTLSPTIRPVCLHTSEEHPTHTEMKASVTGWGRTDAAEDSSDTLLKVTINLLSDELCRSKYQFESKFKDGFESKSMVCAGDELDAKDTCQGDSGGPLQVPLGNEYECMWSQVGITSIGSAFCGSSIPSVYTKVANYVPWIQNIVWPV